VIVTRYPCPPRRAHGAVENDRARERPWQAPQMLAPRDRVQSAQRACRADSEFLSLRRRPGDTGEDLPQRDGLELLSDCATCIL
jgi:hypothetical protein